IAMMVVLLVPGIVRLLTGTLPSHVQTFPLPHTTLTAPMIFIVLKAYASGGAAVTGVEAISNGVPAFKPPEWLNARTTLMWMGCTLGAMFLGLSVLAAHLHVVPDPSEKVTLVAQIGRAVFGPAVGGKILLTLLQLA